MTFIIVPRSYSSLPIVEKGVGNKPLFVLLFSPDVTSDAEKSLKKQLQLASIIC
jgi:hypothetical protein